MSDILLDLQKYWQLNLHLVTPVAAALILVVVIYFCSIGSPSQPSLLLVDESAAATKKEKALAKKKLKQQQLKKQQKPSNGHLVAEAPKPQVEAKPVLETAKPKTPSAAKKVKKTEDTKSQKVQRKPEVVKDGKKEEQSSDRHQRAQMKKEALEGDWVTVVSSKDKKAKQAQPVEAKEAEHPAENVNFVNEEIKRLVAENEAREKSVSSPNEGKNTSKSKKSKQDSSTPAVAKISTAVAEKSSKGSKAATVASKEQPKETSPAANIPTIKDAQPDVRPKEPKPMPPSSKAASGDQPSKPTTDGEKSIQEKLEEAMQPAFDEMGDWEEAKPLKAKNVKKRARREK